MSYTSKSETKKERIMFRLDFMTLQKLDKFSKLENTNISKLIREILDEGLDLREKFYKYFYNLKTLEFVPEIDFITPSEIEKEIKAKRKQKALDNSPRD